MDHLHLAPQRGTAIPKGLRGKARTFFTNVVRDFHLEAYHVELLAQGCWALQRSEEARARVDAEGMTYADDKGKRYPHPCCVIEKENRIVFLRVVRELGLDLADVETARPPSRSGRQLR